MKSYLQIHFFFMRDPTDPILDMYGSWQSQNFGRRLTVFKIKLNFLTDILLQAQLKTVQRVSF